MILIVDMHVHIFDHPPSVNHEPQTYVQSCARKDTLAARFFISHFDAMESVSRLVGRLQHLPSYRPVCCNRPASPLNRPCRSCVANGVRGCHPRDVVTSTSRRCLVDVSSAFQRRRTVLIVSSERVQRHLVDVSSMFRLSMPPPTPPSLPGNSIAASWVGPRVNSSPQY